LKFLEQLKYWPCLVAILRLYHIFSRTDIFFRANQIINFKFDLVKFEKQKSI
jgi:hypothetical protein